MPDDKEFDLESDSGDSLVSDGGHQVLGSMSRIPSGPHPAVSKLQELDFELLPEGFFSIVYGARRTGKTHAVSVLLEQIKHRFDFAYLFSNTALLHKGQEGELDFEMIVDDAKFEGFDEEVLKRIVARQRAVLMHNNNTPKKADKKPNQTLLIFDDFVHETAIRYSKIFTELPVLGRHFQVSVICLSQGYSQVASGGLNKATRQNADLVMTFLPRNLTDVESIGNWYLTKDKVDNMWFVKTACQEEHGMLGIDLTSPHETEFENYCYRYIAPDKVPKYELGKVQWRIQKEEEKRQKKAALAAKVENERAFFVGMGLMEKQQRIGQATGLPPQKFGRMTLFDAARIGGT
jgi:hypothetical protein